jgi:enterobactin synthetase component D
VGDLVRSPAVLPSFASCVTVAFDNNEAVEATGLPAELRRAAPERKRQFLAGRYCALRALERLEPSVARRTVGRGGAGEPTWPAGLTGSVTHTNGLASAAVAWQSDARSIGIDSELRVATARAQAIKPLVMLPGEAGLGGRALDEATRVVLVFSAKEAIFKCLYPLTGRRFYYEDAFVACADVAGGWLTAELITTLATGFEAGTILRGRFELDEARVHTGVWLEPQGEQDADASGTRGNDNHAILQ